MEVLKWLHDMLAGSSPKTGYLGSMGIFFGVMDLMKESITTEGIPQTKFGWLALLFGIAARLSKDADKTNSQHPSATAITVPSVSASPVTVQLIPSGGQPINTTSQ
jgi:hypothetical protein